MTIEIDVSFPGKLKVDAKIGEFVISTDQPEKAGGDNSAPQPFAVFASSIATCAGYFALKFCQSRDIATDGMKLTMKYDWDKELKRFPEMNIELSLPDDFPEKYNKAIQRAMDQCIVKKHIMEPPEFSIILK